MYKKVLVTLLCSTLVYGLTACGNSTSKVEEVPSEVAVIETTEEETTEEETTEKETTEKETTEKETNEETTTQVVPTEATTEEEVAYDINAIAQNWVKDYYVDDWGDPTDDAYLIYETSDGYFSDSVAVNKNFTAGVIVDKVDLQFVFITYAGNYNIPITDVTYTISVKDEKGNVNNFSAWQNAGDERIYTNDTNSIVSMLKTTGTYAFNFEDDKFGDTYTFKVNTDKFSSAYNGL